MTRIPIVVIAVALTAAACTAADVEGDLSIDGRADAPVSPEVSGDERLAIASPADGAAIAGNVVSLEVVGTEAAAGFAVLVDAQPPATGTAVGAAAAWSDASPVTVAGLASGEHALTVIAVDRDGLRSGNAEATIGVRVLGPTIQASAARSVTAGDAVVIDLVFDAGSEGGYQVMIDPAAPPSPGQTIADTDALSIDVERTAERVTIDPLPEGEHEIWIVSTDVDRVARDPMVAASVVLTVA